MRVTSNRCDGERVVSRDQVLEAAASTADCMLQGRIAGGRTGPPAAPARATTSSPIEATRRLPLATHRLTPATHRPSMCNGLHRRHEAARSPGHRHRVLHDWLHWRGTGAVAGTDDKARTLKRYQAKRGSICPYCLSVALHQSRHLCRGFAPRFSHALTRKSSRRPPWPAATRDWCCARSAANIRANDPKH